MAKIHLIPRDMDARMAKALYAEFLGTLLFQFFAGVSQNPLAGSLSYAVLVYATQGVSGGHLNPAISLATVVSGHMHWLKAVLYIIAQILGALVGALLEAALIPGLHVGHNSGAVPGCYFKTGVTNLELWGWETLMTFLLVYVVYAVAVAEPGHGSLGPLAMGLTLFVADAAGGQYTGASLNPARLMGPAFIFLCSWKVFWVYLLGQVIGALAAAGVSASVFGIGNAYQTDVPHTSSRSQMAGHEPLLSRDAGV